MNNSKLVGSDNNISMCGKFLEIEALYDSPNSLTKLWGQNKFQMNKK